MQLQNISHLGIRLRPGRCEKGRAGGDEQLRQYVYIHSYHNYINKYLTAIFQAGNISVLALLHFTCRVDMDNIAFMWMLFASDFTSFIFNCFSKTSLLSKEKLFLHHFGIPEVKMLLKNYVPL